MTRYEVSNYVFLLQKKFTTLHRGPLWKYLYVNVFINTKMFIYKDVTLYSVNTTYYFGFLVTFS